MCFFVCEQQEKVQIRKELWRIEDVIAGLSASKANYKVTISSVTNPGETNATLIFDCTSHVVMSLYLIFKALDHIHGANVLNISHGKGKHCLYTMRVFLLTCLYTSKSPERKFVPSVSASSVPSVSGSPSAMEMRLSQQQQHSPHLSPSSHTPTLSSSPSQQHLHQSVTITGGLKWVSELCHRSKLQLSLPKYCNSSVSFLCL